jgi:uncharacterized membrane protein
MDLFSYNIDWMIYNLVLAFIPVIAGYLFLRIRRGVLHFFYGIIWLLFLPNTIYVITDLLHLIEDFAYADTALKVILIIEYTIFEFIGFITFILALYPFEILIKRSRLKKLSTILLVATNFIIGFAMVLGRIYRVNSWDVFLHPLDVVMAGWNVLNSTQLMTLAILFGLFANIVYFLFRKSIASVFVRYAKKFDH